MRSTASNVTTDPSGLVAVTASVPRGATLVERGDAGDVERLGAVEPQAGGGRTGRVLQGQHAHADEVGAVDALVGLGDDRLDPEQPGALGGPVARGARAVLLAGQHDQRDVGVLVCRRRVVDGRLLAAVEEVAGEAALDAVEQQVLAAGCWRTCRGS